MEGRRKYRPFLRTPPKGDQREGAIALSCQKALPTVAAKQGYYKNLARKGCKATTYVFSIWDAAQGTSFVLLKCDEPKMEKDENCNFYLYTYHTIYKNNNGKLKSLY